MTQETSRRAFLWTTGVAAVGAAGGIPLLRSLVGEHGHEDEGAPEGPRWAMVIDTRKCAAAGNCTACTEACHLAHNVPKILDEKGEVNREEEVKWIWKEPFGHVFHGHEHDFLDENVRERQLPVLCNHCDNPPCVRVCPTQATWKRADGIVMMDMHRCVGCRYCIVGCPYGSRSFNWSDPHEHLDKDKIDERFPTRSKGVVEKCNFCAEKQRSAEDGKPWMPECVAACGERGALAWGDLRDPDWVKEHLAGRFTILRKPELGTQPNVFYVVEGSHA